MKWILSFLLSVFLLSHGKLSASTCSFSKDIGSQCFIYSLEAEEDKENTFNIPFEFKHYASNSASDNEHPHKGKKKNKKGVKPVYYCLPIDSLLFSLVSNTNTIFSKKEFDTICYFSGNGKRGPPYSLV